MTARRREAAARDRRRRDDARRLRRRGRGGTTSTADEAVPPAVAAQANSNCRQLVREAGAWRPGRPAQPPFVRGPDRDREQGIPIVERVASRQRRLAQAADSSAYERYLESFDPRWCSSRRGSGPATRGTRPIAQAERPDDGPQRRAEAGRTGGGPHRVRRRLHGYRDPGRLRPQRMSSPTAAVRGDPCPDVVAPPPRHPRFPLTVGLRGVPAIAILIGHAWFFSGGFGGFTESLPNRGMVRMDAWSRSSSCSRGFCSTGR